MRFQSAFSGLALFFSRLSGASRVREKFIGVWSLIAIEERDEFGVWRPTGGRYGKDPVGQLIYDSNGRMAIQVMRRNRAIMATQEPEGITLDQAWNGHVGYGAYFGTYEIDERDGSVTHHRAAHLDPSQVGSDVTRTFSFEDGMLILKPSPDRRLRWSRAP